MREERLPLQLRKVLQSGGDRSALLATQRLLLGEGRFTEVKEQMHVPPMAALAGRQRSDKIPGGHDGVRGERARFKALPGRHDPGQGLLHQVLHDVAVTDPGSDDPSEKRRQLYDVAMLELTGGRPSAQAHPSWERSRNPSWEAVAVEGHVASAETSSLPAIRVMESPATSQYR